MNVSSFGKIFAFLKSKTSFILCAIGILSVSIFIFIKTSALLETARQMIQKKSEALLADTQIRIGKLSTNFINTISIASLEISKEGGFQNGIFLKIEKVNVKLSPVEFLKTAYVLIKRNPEKLQTEKNNPEIRLIRPSISMIREKKQWVFPQIKKGKGMIPPIKLVLQDGELSVTDDSNEFNQLALKNIEGFVDLKSGSPVFECSAKTSLDEELLIKGQIDSMKFISAELHGKEIQPGHYTRHFQMIPSSYAFSGKIDAEINLAASWPLKWDERKQWKYSGLLKLNELNCELPVGNINRKIVSSGTIKYTDEKIETSNLVIQSSSSKIFISGTVISLKSEPQCRIQCSGQSNFKEWHPLLPEGKASLTMTCSGPIKTPKIQAKISLNESLWANLPLHAEANLLYNSTMTAFDLVSSWGKGKLTTFVKILPNKKIMLAAKLDGLLIEDFFQDPNHELSGKFSFSLSGKGNIENPKIDGKLKIEKFVWAKTKINLLSGLIKCDFKNLRLSLSSPDSKNKGNLEVFSDHSHTLLKECRILFSDNGKVKINGKIEYPSKKISGTVLADSVPPSKIAPFIKLFSNFDGKLFLKGVIDGTLQKPSLKGQLTGNNLVLLQKSGDGRNSVPVGNLSSKMLWNKTSFELPDLLLGNSYEGYFAYWYQPISKFTFKSSVKNGNPKILFALMNSPTDISGKLNGKIDFSYRKNPNLGSNETALEGKGDCAIFDGHWGDALFEKFNLKYDFSKSALEIKNLSFKQKGGSLTFHANAKQTGEKNPLEAGAKLENFIFSENLFNGDLHLAGNFFVNSDSWFSGLVKSENLHMNRLKIGGILGTIALKDKILSFKNFSLANFIKGNYEIQYGVQPSPKVSGHWTSEIKDVKEWISLLRLGDIPVTGKMAISGTVEGTLSDISYVLNSKFMDLKLSRESKNSGSQNEKEGFNGNANATLSKKILKSLTVKMATMDGGKFTLLGQANLKSKELSLETYFNQVDSSLFLEPVGMKMLEGKSEGHFLIKGDWTNPVIKGEVKGFNGHLGTIPLDYWETAGTFQEKELLFSRLKFMGQKGSWRFSILEDSWIRPGENKKNGSFHLITDIANLRLGPVSFVGNGILEGNWTIPEKNSPPIFEGTLKVNECLANSYEIPPMDLQVRFHDKKLVFLPIKNPPQTKQKIQKIVTGEIDFSKLPSVTFKQLTVLDSDKRSFYLNGEISPEKPIFIAEGHEVDSTLISRILESPLDFSGKASFKMQGTVSNNQPQIKGEFSFQKGLIDRIPVDNLTCDYQWKAGDFILSKLQAQLKDRYLIRANGSFPLKWGTIEPSQPKINFLLKLSDGNIYILNFLENDLVKNAEGTLSADLNIKGNPENPKISGQFEISNGEMDSRYLTRKAKELSLKIKIESNRVLFEKAKCKIGEGQLNLSGKMSCALERGDFAFDNFNIILKTIGQNGIPIQISELPLGQEKIGISSPPSKGSPLFSIQVTGGREKPKITGWTELKDTVFSYPSAKKLGSEHYWTDRAEWDFKLRTGRQTTFQNDFANVRINGDLNFNGTRDDLQINGKIDSNQGTISIYGAKFDLIDASLEFLQPPALTIKNTQTAPDALNVAYLQFKAERTIDIPSSIGGQKIQDTISVQLDKTPLTANFDSGKIIFRSAQDPNLTSEKVANRAGIGIDLEGLTPEEKEIQLRQGIARLLDAQLASPIARAILQKTGLVHNVEINQETSTGRTEEVRGNKASVLDPLIGQSILLERTFAGKLGVGYKATFDKIKDRADFIHELQLRYPFYKGIWLYGSTELDSKDNLGREPERKGGIQWGTKFDPADVFKWLKKDKKLTEKKTN